MIKGNQLKHYIRVTQGYVRLFSEKVFNLHNRCRAKARVSLFQ